MIALILTWYNRLHFTYTSSTSADDVLVDVSFFLARKARRQSLRATVLGRSLLHHPPTIGNSSGLRVHIETMSKPSEPVDLPEETYAVMVHRNFEERVKLALLTSNHSGTEDWIRATDAPVVTTDPFDQSRFSP